MSRKVKVIAHRGVSSEAPENTLSAFAQAAEMEVDAIELDVHLSEEGIPIVMHDSTFGRTTDGAHQKRTTSLRVEEIKSLDAGAWFHDRFKGEKVPTLKEVVDLLQGKIPLMIEIKKENSPPEQIVRAVIEAIAQTEGEILIGSFDASIVSETVKQGPKYPVIGIVEDLEMINAFKLLSVRHLAIWFPLLTPELISKLHGEGILLWTFTVDHPELAQYIASFGIDGIITNNPRAILKLLS